MRIRKGSVGSFAPIRYLLEGGQLAVIGAIGAGEVDAIDDPYRVDGFRAASLNPPLTAPPRHLRGRERSVCHQNGRFFGLLRWV
jgi:hypothetical protein